jgi:hypothetical protein
MRATTEWLRTIWHSEFHDNQKQLRVDLLAGLARNGIAIATWSPGGAGAPVHAAGLTMSAGEPHVTIAGDIGLIGTQGQEDRFHNRNAKGRLIYGFRYMKLTRQSASGNSLTVIEPGCDDVLPEPGGPRCRYVC